MIGKKVRLTGGHPLAGNEGICTGFEPIGHITGNFYRVRLNAGCDCCAEAHEMEGA